MEEAKNLDINVIRLDEIIHEELQVISSTNQSLKRPINWQQNKSWNDNELFNCGAAYSQ